MRSTRSVLLGACTALLLAVSAAPVGAAAPSVSSWTDPPFEDVLADCGTYEVREVGTFSARAIAYPDGTTRVHANIDGWLYRTDDPETVIGREHTNTVRFIDGAVATITGNRWHILISGSGMTAHDVGRLVFNFETRDVVSVNGKHAVLDGEFDFATLCDL